MYFISFFASLIFMKNCSKIYIILLTITIRLQRQLLCSFSKRIFKLKTSLFLHIYARMKFINLVNFATYVKWMIIYLILMSSALDGVCYLWVIFLIILWLHLILWKANDKKTYVILSLVFHTVSIWIIWDIMFKWSVCGSNFSRNMYT